eukprot:CAMPEP_0176504862 /NCGR_PEP_ID=MMETSP0200_2-20121128/16179_1 /TAXON_ID=947934 /ORGANISM="Chaetoceros sp., Strain GSL56" /LENGTH=694 /DNA_ID=CAMNT_0017904361 /DNA_START=1356 /DNA_END=3440 /DNA_ORIENTATION=-
MMMETSKLDKANEESYEVDDRQAEIERRLAALGDISTDAPTDSNEDAQPTDTDADRKIDNVQVPSSMGQDQDLTAEEMVNVVDEAPPAQDSLHDASRSTLLESSHHDVPSSEPATQTLVEPSTVATTSSSESIKSPTNSKSALLARIMAAQERARQAQMKQTQYSSSSLKLSDSAKDEKEKMMEALAGLNKQRVDQKALMQVPPPPPPAFDVFEEQMMKMQSRSDATATTQSAPPPPPPAFDTIAPQIFAQHSSSSNVAPAVTLMNASDADLLGGDFGSIQPMAPPISAPSFEQVMQQQQHLDWTGSAANNMAVQDSVEDVHDFDLDENGMKLSPEEKRKLIEEQRAIMERIEREARNNKASEAAIKADAFAARMSGGNSAAPVTSPLEISTNIDGFSASEIEEQKKILEQIQREAKGSHQRSQTGDQRGSVESINIGGGQNVQLHGQEKTEEAIKKGTAQLVLCLNCNNWMQVAESATLMFCPICSVVSPVVQQDQVMSKAELLQMEQDRKLAESLQAEERAAVRGDGSSSEYPGNRRAATARASASVGSTEKSWWDTISEALVGVGVSADAPDAEKAKRSSDYVPPGSSFSNQRTLHSAITGEEGGDEHLGLLSSEGGVSGRPAARVATSQPLFSCVVDSISSTANAASHYIMGDDDDDEEGVDTTSFLAVPNAGREKNESDANYFAIPPEE